MNVKLFLDSNLLIYYATEPTRAPVIAELIRSNEGAICSTQTLNEFVNVCLKRKLLPTEAIDSVIQQFLTLFQVEMLTLFTTLEALRIKRRYGFQFYDSLIIGTALEANCVQLFSEDLQHGQVIDGRLRILNPFLL